MIINRIGLTIIAAFVVWVWIEMIVAIYRLHAVIPGPLHLFG